MAFLILWPISQTVLQALISSIFCKPGMDTPLFWLAIRKIMANHLRNGALVRGKTVPAVKEA